MDLSEAQKGVLCGVLFQLLWFICIFCPLFVILLSSAGFLLLYFTFISNRFQDFVFAGVLAAIGYSIDAIWLYIGVFEMPSLIPPLWLGILWLLFSMSLPYAFYFLRHRIYLGAVVGGLGGGLSYLSAITFRGDVSFGVPVYLGFVYVATLWMIFFPLAMASWGYFTSSSRAHG